MKTRIKIIEYNDGNKKYICQRFSLYDSYESIFFGIFTIFMPTLWPTLGKIHWIDIFVTDNIDDAKKHIYEKHKEHDQKVANEKYEKWKNKIKSKTYLKYP